eukprot:CAMPEP_0174303228 /NCGR_PEP_ID=MMETSP0809-20121228/60063_1 /TAXON_ID=73025 ORGANISM="Eutreptiella gymnastica-like, Strain CCMP1594" /NCGR_SAMPLE_ID=MMETSP0809 /ASSEMBLY_ACC=CAM_ASM_000658 /LENGTH=143 /DNA_ID=CAMNT_0015409215 /DNA_START=723 /DNA_END=1155 /DNA_ORIENTATION=-
MGPGINGGHARSAHAAQSSPQRGKKPSIREPPPQGTSQAPSWQLTAMLAPAISACVRTHGPLSDMWRAWDPGAAQSLSASPPFGHNHDVDAAQPHASFRGHSPAPQPASTPRHHDHPLELRPLRGVPRQVGGLLPVVIHECDA